VEFKIGNGLDIFLREFADADVIWIEFQQGDEPRWEARMIGSRKAAQMFKHCIYQVIDGDKSATTQPYSGGGSTQPFGSGKKPTQPTQPIAPKLTREDDGSI